MANINLKFNPYTKIVEKCKCDGENIDVTNWGYSDRELGDWALDFIEKIVSKYNDRKNVIDFEGIERDANFLEDAAKQYVAENKGVEIKVNCKSSITPSKKFDELKTLFKKMQVETPYEDLKDEKLKELFNKAVSSEFELAVVATMSSGKSTLINAMIGHDLLPARNEATTANLAKIHDIDKKKDFDAVAFNSDHEEIERRNNVSQKDVEELNRRGNDSSAKDFVSVIELYGDILGIDSSNLQLVMTDTPGPNNSQNVEHQAHTYSLFKQEYKPMILYVLNACQLGTNDDNNLLRHVAESMAEGNRQSKDRFIFVLNKADGFDPEKGENLDDIINKVKVYLGEHGINGAKIFPCDARSAKVFRQYLNGYSLTETEEDDILPRHKNIVKREWRHFSNKAPLSLACRKQLNAMLDEAELEPDEERRSIKQALIYTGVPAIELAISEYLAKYALPAKLAKGVDSFKQKIDNLGLEAQTNKNIAENKSGIDRALKTIEQVERILSNGQMGKNLAEGMKNLNVKKDVEPKFNACRTKFMNVFRQEISAVSAKVTLNEAQNYRHRLMNVLKDLQASFKTDVDAAIESSVKNLVKQQIEKLNETIEGLIDKSDFNVGSAGSLLGNAGTISVSEAMSEFEYSERVKVGSHWVENTHKKWYKPWTWGEVSSYEVDDYENVKKIDFSKFISQKISPEVEDYLDDMRKLATEYATNEENRLLKYFDGQIKEIERKIQEKLDEKKTILSNKEKMEKSIKENEKNLKWIKDFKKQLDDILVV